jgi:hypothetical protein
MTQHFLNTRNRNKEKTQPHAHKSTNTYYKNTRQGITPKKYTDTRATHNHYIQTKTRENHL